MNWLAAIEAIRFGISEGDNLNTSRSNWRKVLRANQPFSKNNREEGFVVQIGQKQTSNIKISCKSSKNSK